MLTQGQREVDHHRGSAGERPLRPAGTASLWGRQLHTLSLAWPGLASTNWPASAAINHQVRCRPRPFTGQGATSVCWPGMADINQQ